MISTDPTLSADVSEKLDKKGYNIISSSVEMVPKDVIEVEDSTSSKLIDLIENLDDHDDIQNLSIDESDSESGLYFRGSNLQEDEDEDFSPSASPSAPVASFAVETRVASPATEVETRVPVTEESEAIAALSVQPQRHLSAEQDDASEEDSTFNFPNDTLDILPLESVTSE